MTSAQRRRRAVVLSNFDLPGWQSLLIHGCEDCACPVTEDRAFASPDLQAVGLMADTVQWVRGRELIEIPLDAEHWLVFNPLAAGGAVVINTPAHRVLRQLDHPTTMLGADAASAGDVDAVTDALRSLAALGIIHPAGQPQRPTFEPSKVLTAWLHVTNACNLRCPYCYLAKTADGMDEATGRAAIDAVIRSAVRHDFSGVKLKYAGGEASMSHRLVSQLHDYAASMADDHGLDLHATLLSNGVMLPPELLETLKTGGIRVMISLDGIGRDHDVQRPTVNHKPTFRQVDRTIDRLISSGLKPHLSITITNHNAAGIAAVVRYALERDLTFSLNFFRDNDCAASFPDLQYEEKSMIAALLDAFAVIGEFVPRWSVLGAVLDKGQLLRPQSRSCGVGQDYVVIDQHGQVAKCHMEIERTLGDVLSDDPLDLVRADRTSALNLISDEKEGCRDCTWRYWCTGGCTVATFRATGRYDIKSPNCNIYRAIYPEALRLEGLRLLKYAPASLSAGG